MQTLSTGFTTLDVICGILTCLLVVQLLTNTRRLPKGLRLPPGPPGKPIIGNVTDMPKSSFWETFDRWAKDYGDLVHINLLGRSIIVVSSLEIAHELFDKRSSIYSDRINFPMLVDMMGWDWNIATMRYGNWWRRHRRLLHQHFRPEAAVSYRDTQTRQTRTLLRMLHESPDDFNHHIRHYPGATIMEIIYGIKVLPREDPYIKLAETAVAIASEAASPGRFLVDILPILKYVPEWMPGAGFRRMAREGEEAIRKMAEMPFKAVKEALDAGTAEPSIAATLIETLSSRIDAPADEYLVSRNATGNAYAAGADTTVSTLMTFVLAMTIYPEVQKKAQTELDNVVGDHLPLFENYSSLPYVAAICKEVHRWHPAFPLGIGHRVMEDDVYGEYFIPAGSLVIGNAWTMLHNEETYGPHPEAFDPERFLRPGATDPVGHFGFGRRVCVGRYMADSSLFIAIASILKVFEISPPRDSSGREIPNKPAYNSGLLLQPEPFLCTIKPRSESAKALILSTVDD